MTTWIGIEYLVANAFIHSIEHTNQRYLKIETIFTYQKNLMNDWNINKIDALVVGNLSRISREFKEWFSLFNTANLIVLNEDITLDMLKERFVLLDNKIQESFLKSAKALF